MLQPSHDELAVFAQALEVQGHALVGLAQLAHFPLHFIVAVQPDLFLHLAHKRLYLLELVPHVA